MAAKANINVFSVLEFPVYQNVIAIKFDYGGAINAGLVFLLDNKIMYL